MMGAPGTLIPAEVPSSQIQNYGFAGRDFAEIAGQPNNLYPMLANETDVLGVLSDCTVGRVQTKELVEISSQTKPDEMNRVKVNEAGRYKHTAAYECSSHPESSHAENMHVKNVSQYVLSAAKNPEFASKLHTILLESGASPPSDLFSDMNSRDRGLDSVQADQNRLLLSYDKSLMIPQGVGPAGGNTRLYQLADQLAEQQKELHTDATEFYDSSQSSTRNAFATVSGKDSDIEQSNPLIVDFTSFNTRKEKCPESSLPKAALSCKRHNGVECFCDDDESGPRNEAGASLNNVELGNDSVIQINETVGGDCIIYDDSKSKKVHPILGEDTQWEVQWEDLRIGERIGIGKSIPRF
jgi:sterile alpha motif and leucine zipper-containing kinase AZK